MPRVNLYLRDELLVAINRRAQHEKTTRSSLIQTALENYIKAKRRGSEEKGTRKKMQQASRKIDALAKKLGKRDPQKTIRKFRESDIKGVS